MNYSDAIFFGTISILAINIFISRTRGWEKKPWLFLMIQGLNLVIGSLLIWFGIPEFNQKGMEIVNWILGLIFFYHVIQNNRSLQNQKREERA